MSQFDLIGIGAPIMDVVAQIPESFLAQVRGDKGGMVMIDSDEMTSLISRLPALPAMTPGGSAANTTYNATRLGLRTTFLGKLGNDELATIYQAAYTAIGVDTSRFKHGSLPNARCLILTTPDTQRTMRTYLGAVMTLSPDEISPDDFAHCRHAHLEGYVLFNPALANKIIDSARAAGCPLGLSLASFEVVSAARGWIDEQLKKGLQLVFANDDEARALYPDLPVNSPEDYAAHARRLASHGCTAAITLGKHGAWIARGNELHRIAPVVITDAIDTNGAGDSWAAGFLAGYLKGATLPACGNAASIIAAETVRHLGPLIPDAAWPATATRARQVLAH